MSMIGVMFAVDADTIVALEDEGDPSALFELSEGDGAVQLEKFWGSVRDVLSRGFDPVFGGEPVGPDFGFGPAFVVSPERVREMAAGFGGCWSGRIGRPV